MPFRASDGFRGRQTDLTVPVDVTFTDCDRGEYDWLGDGSGGDRYNQSLGQQDILDVLDVNGRTLEILTAFYSANTAADQVELQAIVDSIKITP